MSAEFYVDEDGSEWENAVPVATVDDIAALQDQINVLYDYQNNEVTLYEDPNQWQQDELQDLAIEDLGKRVTLLETVVNEVPDPTPSPAIVQDVKVVNQVKSGELTLDDIHADLEVLNDNLYISAIIIFAAALALLGFLIGKELWKPW